MIQLENVLFRWRESGPVILDIGEFSVARGERVLLRGPSGAGKTTLLNLLGGIATPERGRVVVDGQELTALSAAGRDALRADRIGFIFQLFNLVPYLGLIDNVTLPCWFSPERHKRACAELGSAEREASRLLEVMHLDLAALGKREVAALSVGQQQRVAAARALIGAPSLLIADEPTSAFDPATREAFLELLFAEASRCEITLLMVSHDPELEPRFDRTVMLSSINRAA